MNFNPLRVDDTMNNGMEALGFDDENARLQRFLYAMRVSTPKVWATQVIVGLNVLVYAWMVLTGYDLFAQGIEHPFLEEGANYAPFTIAHGETWRLLTCMFLHGPIYHIALNMWVLWVEGKMVERLLGNTNFVIAYIASGLVGSLASVYFNPGVPSIGASGAIFGVIGALFALLYRHRAEFPRPMRLSMMKTGGLFVALNVGFYFSVPNIDLAAHIGGLVAGVAAGWILSHPMTREGLASRTRRGLTLSISTVFVLVIASTFYPLERMNVPLGHEELKPQIEALDTLRQDSLNVAKEIDEGRLNGQLTGDQAAVQIRTTLLPRWREYRERVLKTQPSTSHGKMLKEALDVYVTVSHALWVELALDVRGRLAGRGRVEALREERKVAETRLIALWRTQ
jgi:rhomboid protease GluP